MTTINVGFIGLGLMGHAMANNIQSKGFSLGVMAHRNRQPVDDLVGKGAREFANAAELTRAVDVVLLCLPGRPRSVAPWLASRACWPVCVRGRSWLTAARVTRIAPPSWLHR